MINSNVFLFSQALNNKDTDDWYYYSNGIQEIQVEEDRSYVNNLLCSIMENGKKKSFDVFDGYYVSTENNDYNVVLLIQNGQKDIVGRKSRTAIVIKELFLQNIEISKLFVEFSSKTNKELPSFIIEKFSKSNSLFFEDLKKKAGKSKSYLLWFILFSTLSLVLIQILKK